MKGIMTFLLLVATAVSAQTSHKHVQSAQPPAIDIGRNTDTFMGIQFDKPLSTSLKKCDEPSADPTHCYSMTTYGQQFGEHSYEVRRPDASPLEVIETTDSFQDTEYRVQELSDSIQANELTEYLDGLTHKYGAPTDSWHSTIENGFGATMDAAGWVWNLGGVVIFLSGPQDFKEDTGVMRALSLLRWTQEREQLDHKQKKIENQF